MSDWLCRLSGDYVCRAFYPEQLASWIATAVTLGAAIAAILTLWGLRDQNSIARDALADNRRAFALTNRAKLVVRRVVMLADPDVGALHYAAYVDVGNIGATQATIIKAKAALYQRVQRALPGEMEWQDIWSPNELACVFRTIVNTHSVST